MNTKKKHNDKLHIKETIMQKKTANKDDEEEGIKERKINRRDYQEERVGKNRRKGTRKCEDEEEELKKEKKNVGGETTMKTKHIKERRKKTQ